MARGSLAKEEITKKILETFPESFTHEKEIRIPWVEESDNLQIKVTLTCAKTNVENGQDTKIPGEAGTTSNIAEAINKPVAPSEKEKEAVADLIARLGL